MTARAAFGLVALAACGAHPAGGGGPPPTARAPTHVACLGDSLTAGYAASRPTAAYPAVLQRLLGPDVKVGNFGHLGAALRSDADIPYTSQREYVAARKFIADAGPGAVVDVVIELGANDARPPNWEGDASATAFATQYEAMITELAAEPSHPRLILAIPAAVTAGNEFEIDDGVLGGKLAPVIVKLAARHHLPVIDLRTPAIPRGEDGVHPTDAGYAQIADLVRAALAQ